MPTEKTRCKICWSEHCDAVNRLAVRGIPARDLAAMFSFKVATTARHVKEHVPKMLAMAHAEKLALDADGLQRELCELYGIARELLNEAYGEFKTRASDPVARDRAFVMTSASLREASRLLEFAARLIHQLPEAKPEAITIRIVEDETPARDALGDIVGKDIPPGLHRKQRALPPPSVQATNLSSVPATAVRDNLTESDIAREIFRAIRNDEIPNDVRVKINDARTRRGLMPLLPHTTFAEAIEQTENEIQMKEEKHGMR